MPTEHARGPWDPGALHGGPVAALVTRALEQAPSQLTLARLTLELLRPVPLRPLQVDVKTVRPGKRIQIDDVSLTCDGQLVSAARALRIREAPVEVPPAGVERLQAGPEDCVAALPFGDGPAFHATGVEMRFPEPRPPRASARAILWVRLAVPVVDGETPSPFQRAAAAADFGNGVSSPLPYETTTFINPDLTVALFRAPRGEWIGMDARTHVGALGRGLAESALHDVHGRVGSAAQSLLLAPR